MIHTVECETGQQRNKLVKTAAYIAIGGNLLLAALKIAFGLRTGSLAVLGDGIDSSSDVAIALMTLAVGFIISQPSDKEHPWGHSRAETLATIVLAFIIMIAGFQLCISAIQKLFSGELTQIPPPLTLAVTGVSILGKLALAFSQYTLGKKSGSAMIMANAKNMTNDIFISSSVLVGLAASILLKLPFLDPLAGFIVSLWVMKSAVEIFSDLRMELMDGNADDQLYRDLFTAVKSVTGAGNPHRARIRKMASLWDIDLDIEVDGRMCVREAHEIAEAVAREIKCRIPDVYDVMVHVEPSGQGEHSEQFGLCVRDVQ